MLSNTARARGSAAPPSPDLLGDSFPAGIIPGIAAVPPISPNRAGTGTGAIRSAAPGASRGGQAAPGRVSLGLFPIQRQDEPLQPGRGWISRAAAAPGPAEVSQLFGAQLKPPGMALLITLLEAGRGNELQNKSPALIEPTAIAFPLVSHQKLHLHS